MPILTKFVGIRWKKIEISMRFKKLVRCKYLAVDHCDKQKVRGDIFLLFWSNVALMFVLCCYCYCVATATILLASRWWAGRQNLEQHWGQVLLKRQHSFLFPSLLLTFTWHCNFFRSIIRFFFFHFQGFHLSCFNKKEYKKEELDWNLVHEI